MYRKLVIVLAALLVTTEANPSALDVLQDMYYGCLQDFSIGCVKPKALAWISNVWDQNVIKITEDLELVKKNNEEQRSLSEDIFDKFEDFIQDHDLIAKVPTILRPEGALNTLLPRNFQQEDLKVPLAVTGRSKLVKKVIVPFLLGLKFKTAVLVPLALALIALKTWKALTLGLLSLVLTGAIIMFKFTKPKVVNYEVVHYPHHDHHDHHEHHVDHLDHPPVAGWDQPVYGRQLNAQEMAYNAYVS